jgi:hypothetical protein
MNVFPFGMEIVAVTNSMTARLPAGTRTSLVKSIDRLQAGTRCWFPPDEGIVRRRQVPRMIARPELGRLPKMRLPLAGRGLSAVGSAFRNVCKLCLVLLRHFRSPRCYAGDMRFIQVRAPNEIGAVHMLAGCRLIHACHREKAAGRVG